MFHLLSLLGGVFHHVVAERMIVYASCLLYCLSFFFNHWLLDLTAGMLVSCLLSQSVLISNSSAEKLYHLASVI